MKKLFVFLCTMVFVFGLAGISNAINDPWSGGSEKNLYEIFNDIFGTIYGSSDDLFTDRGLADSHDDWWQETDGQITLTVRYAGYDQALGIEDDDGLSTLVESIDPGEQEVVVNFNANGNFVWVEILSGSGSGVGPWYSDDRDTPDDHFLAFDVSDFYAGDPSIQGAWLIAFEDQEGLGDQDYNDLVAVVVDCVPLVDVPDVVGLVQAEAEAAIVSAGLVVGNITVQTSCTVPAEEVISQDPDAGTSVAMGSAVDLAISLGGVKVYEDAENGNTLGWSVSDNVPGGATVTNVEDLDSGHNGTRVIQLSGYGTLNAYELKNEDGSDWHNTEQLMITWSGKFSIFFYIYVDVQTTLGHRYIYYTPQAGDLLGTGEYVHHGIGAGAMNGQWQSFQRDLEADLQDAQPTNSIVEVNRFYVRGSGRVDDIKLRLVPLPLLSISDVTVSEGDGSAEFTISTSAISSTDITVAYNTMDDTAQAPDDYESTSDIATILAGDSSTQISVTINDDQDWEGPVDERFFVILSNPSSNAGINDGIGIGTIVDNDCPDPTVYEDAEDADTLGWSVFDNVPPLIPENAITNVYDNDRQSRVIALSGYGTLNAYELKNEDGSDWHNADQFVIEWSGKFSEFFYIFVDVETTQGHRYIYYTPENINLLGTKEYVHHGIGTGAMNGQWQTFQRDLEADLKDAQPTNTIAEVNGFYVRGSGRVDDITLLCNEMELLSGGGDFILSKDAMSIARSTSAGIVESDVNGIAWSTSDGIVESKE
jgi:hypothetical protein